METASPRLLNCDERDDRRVGLRLPGYLFVVAEDSCAECTVINLSAGGAGVLCFERPPPLSTLVVLYVETFGRFEAVTRHYTDHELGLEFVCRDLKRKRLEEDLITYLQQGLQGVTRLRRHSRTATASSARLRLEGSGEMECQVMDVSLQGARIRTSMRPKVGEQVFLGKTRGYVVRHDPDGIAVQFCQPN